MKITLKIGKWMTILFVGTLVGARTSTAAVSAQCEADTTALSENSALTQAAPLGSCTVYVDISNTCTFDFDSINADFETLCGQLGGNFYAEDISLDCRVYLAGQYYDVTYNYLNFPACFGGSCTDAEAMGTYENLVFPAFEKQLALQGVTCDAMGENGSGQGSQSSGQVNRSASVRGALSFVVLIISVVTTVSSNM
jgi:hypothetical protein